MDLIADLRVGEWRAIVRWMLPHLLLFPWIGEVRGDSWLCEARTLLPWGGDPSPGPEDDSLNSERPTFTPNSTSLGRRVFQIETGYLYTREVPQGEPSIVSHQMPETQLRWGLFADWFEFRISQAFLSQEEMSTRLDGASDTQLGILLALTMQRGIIPECAVIPSIYVPSGSTWATDGTTRGGVALSYSWGFLEHWTLGASTQWNTEIDDLNSAPYMGTYQSCYLKRKIGEKTSLYGEWYASYPHNALTALPENYMNTGWLILLRDNLQWDARVGAGLLEDESNFFAGTGFTIRFR